MGYQGYLVKVGEYKIPYKYINSSTYIGKKSVQDLNSYRDGNGKLHREVLSHIPCKAEFETPPNINSSEFAELMKNIKANYIDEVERKASVTIFISEDDEYVTQDMYMPDIEIPIDSELNGKLLYKPTRLAFVGY